jgi:hypothetical protein
MLFDVETRIKQLRHEKQVVRNTLILAGRGAIRIGAITEKEMRRVIASLLDILNKGVT